MKILPGPKYYKSWLMIDLQTFRFCKDSTPVWFFSENQRQPQRSCRYIKCCQWSSIRHSRLSLEDPLLPLGEALTRMPVVHDDILGVVHFRHVIVGDADLDPATVQE